MAKKRAPQFFTTVTDMRAIKAEKIDNFCEDLRLWLHMHKQVETLEAASGIKLQITTPTDSFGWIDDGRHDARIKISMDKSMRDALLAYDNPEGCPVK